MSVRDTLKKSRPSVHSVEVSTGPVFVRAFNGAARHRYSELSKACDTGSGKAADGVLPLHTIVALGLCEENGDLCFSMDNERDIGLANNELREVASADLQIICLKLFEVSGLGKDAVEKAEKK